MKKLALTAVCGVMTASVLLITGCDDWSSGGDSSWSGRYDWVNFSGVYRGVGGGPLVTNYSDQRDQPGNIVGESFATGNGLQTAFSGGLNNRRVAPGTVTVTAGGVVMRDNGDGALEGNGNTGTITYANGFVTLEYAAPPAAGVPIQVSYSFSRPTDLPSLGSTGRIYTFSVEHTGNRMTITDNNGAVYKGTLGRVSTTGGQTTGQDPIADGEIGSRAVGTTVIATFTASGVSGAGREVTMTGTMNAIMGEGELANRTMEGTWIEKGGKTGNILGGANDVLIVEWSELIEE